MQLLSNLPSSSLLSLLILLLAQSAQGYVYFLVTDWEDVHTGVPKQLYWSGDGTAVNISLYHGQTEANMAWVRNITTKQAGNAFVWDPKDSNLVGLYRLVIYQSGLSMATPVFIMQSDVARLPPNMTGTITVTASVHEQTADGIAAAVTGTAGNKSAIANGTLIDGNGLIGGGLGMQEGDVPNNDQPKIIIEIEKRERDVRQQRHHRRKAVEAGLRAVRGLDRARDEDGVGDVITATVADAGDPSFAASADSTDSSDVDIVTAVVSAVASNMTANTTASTPSAATNVSSIVVAAAADRVRADNGRLGACVIVLLATVAAMVL